MCAVLHRKAVRRRRRWRTHRRIPRETARVHRPGDPPAPTAGCPVGRHILVVRQNSWARQSRDQPAMAELSGLAGHRTDSSSSAAMAPHRSDAGLSLPGGTSQNYNAHSGPVVLRSRPRWRSSEPRSRRSSGRPVRRVTSAPTERSCTPTTSRAGSRPGFESRQAGRTRARRATACWRQGVSREVRVRAGATAARQRRPVRASGDVPPYVDRSTLIRAGWMGLRCRRADRAGHRGHGGSLGGHVLGSAGAVVAPSRRGRRARPVGRPPVEAGRPASR